MRTASFFLLLQLLLQILPRILGNSEGVSDSSRNRKLLQAAPIPCTHFYTAGDPKDSLIFGKF